MRRHLKRALKGLLIGLLVFVLAVPAAVYSYIEYGKWKDDREDAEQAESLPTYPGFVEFQSNDGIYQYDGRVIDRSTNTIHKFKDTGDIMTGRGSWRLTDRLLVPTTAGVLSVRWGDEREGLVVEGDFEDEMHPNTDIVENEEYVFYDGNGSFGIPYETRWCKLRKGADLSTRECKDQLNVAPYESVASEDTYYLFQDTTRLEDGTAHMVWAYDVETMELIDTYDVGTLVNEYGDVKDLFWHDGDLHLMFNGHLVQMDETGEFETLSWREEDAFDNFDYITSRDGRIYLWQQERKNENGFYRMKWIDLSDGQDGLVEMNGTGTDRSQYCVDALDHSSTGAPVLSYRCVDDNLDSTTYYHHMETGETVAEKPFVRFHLPEGFLPGGILPILDRDELEAKFE